MKLTTPLILFITISLILTLSYALVSQEQAEESPYCTGIYANYTRTLVVNVVDGDTFDISSDHRVRIICIDAPERWESGYEESKEALRDLIYRKYVCLEKDISEVDRYGRLLRYVHICLDDECSKGMNIGNYLVENGFAVVYRFEPDVRGCLM